MERETRLELATPTLARSCSTNWAIPAFEVIQNWIATLYKFLSASQAKFLKNVASEEKYINSKEI